MAKTDKYLSTIIKDIFTIGCVSTDSKVILVVLAAMLRTKDFLRFICQISEIYPIRESLLEINQIRWQLGSCARKSILLKSLEYCTSEINGSEISKIIQTYHWSVIDDLLDDLQKNPVLTEAESGWLLSNLHIYSKEAFDKILNKISGRTNNNEIIDKLKVLRIFTQEDQNIRFYVRRVIGTPPATCKLLFEISSPGIAKNYERDKVQAVEYLYKILNSEQSICFSELIIDLFAQIRQNLSPVIAYQVIIAAVTEFIVVGGSEFQDAYERSTELVINTLTSKLSC